MSYFAVTAACGVLIGGVIQNAVCVVLVVLWWVLMILNICGMLQVEALLFRRETTTGVFYRTSYCSNLLCVGVISRIYVQYS